MQQNIRLDGKTALVTGASSGLGWRFAQVLAQAGASVALAARSTDKLDELKREIEQAGGKRPVRRFKGRAQDEEVREAGSSGDQKQPGARGPREFRHRHTETCLQSPLKSVRWPAVSR